VCKILVFKNNISESKISEEFNNLEKEFTKEFHDFDDSFQSGPGLSKIPLIPDISNIIDNLSEIKDLYLEKSENSKIHGNIIN